MFLFRITTNSVVGREMTKLLKVPIEHYNNLVELLRLDSYGQVLLSLDGRGQRHIAATLVQKALDADTSIENEEHLDKVY